MLCERIPEESGRTRDYQITISGIKLYAEVKEIVASEEEIKVTRQLSEMGSSDAYGENRGKPSKKATHKSRDLPNSTIALEFLCFTIIREWMGWVGLTTITF